MSSDLDDEARRATELLKGKTVRQVLQHRRGEVGIEFSDGTRFFVDHQPGELEISITLGKNKDSD